MMSRKFVHFLTPLSHTFAKVLRKRLTPSSSDVIYDWPLIVPCFVAVLLGAYVLSVCQCVLFKHEEDLTVVEIFCKKENISKKLFLIQKHQKSKSEWLTLNLFPITLK